MSGARATARANIALAKYWGKSDEALNLPAVPSVSITLDGLVTETEVAFEEGLDADRVSLDGELAGAKESARVVKVLDQLRQRADTGLRARVTSHNRFPTAAGLASSASGFAALVAAAAGALNLTLTFQEMSALARAASASAARSIFGGYVELAAGALGDAQLGAVQFADPDHWDLRVIVVTTAAGRKTVGSRAAMNRSRDNAVFYRAWVDESVELANRVRRAILERDFDALTMASEQSFLAMHATAMTSVPPLLYWNPVSVRVLHRVWELRERGVPVFSTMDAGPHVKAVCPSHVAARIAEELSRVEGVLATRICPPGRGVEVTKVRST